MVNEDWIEKVLDELFGIDKPFYPTRQVMREAIKKYCPFKPGVAYVEWSNRPLPKPPVAPIPDQEGIYWIRFAYPKATQVKTWIVENEWRLMRVVLDMDHGTVRVESPDSPKEKYPWSAYDGYVTQVGPKVEPPK